ncbi:MAG: isoprenyl transferase [Alphaproteobacteria bacterium]|nr:isoprenyl transferase [Alphaproteobacteria bacterium]
MADTSDIGAAPRHVAIIMDGNGRWAKARGAPRTQGHSAGVEALRRTVEAAGDLKLPYLTVFGFSTENWGRPKEEVSALLELLRIYVGRDLDRLVRDGVKVRVIGERGSLAPDIRAIIERAEERTAANASLHLTIAFNYGAQDEIVRAVHRVADDVAAGRLAPSEVTAETFAMRLDTAGLPPLDLLVRTSGEKRLSNFMLWQAAYAELVFLDDLWPDFGHVQLERAINDFRRRDRRFGGVGRDE